MIDAPNQSSGYEGVQSPGVELNMQPLIQGPALFMWYANGPYPVIGPYTPPGDPPRAIDINIPFSPMPSGTNSVSRSIGYDINVPGSSVPFEDWNNISVPSTSSSTITDTPGTSVGTAEADGSWSALGSTAMLWVNWIMGGWNGVEPITDWNDGDPIRSWDGWTIGSSGDASYHSYDIDWSVEQRSKMRIVGPAKGTLCQYANAAGGLDAPLDTDVPVSCRYIELSDKQYLDITPTCTPTFGWSGDDPFTFSKIFGTKAAFWFVRTPDSFPWYPL